MDFIEGKGIVFKYDNENVINGIDLNIKEGTFNAVIGHNGSGKSTLAKLINALLVPNEGELYVCGMLTGDGKNLWQIRKAAGMVFQNPDDQLVTSIVEEDIAFGAENIGISPEEIENRIASALEKVNMTQYRKHNVNTLSGGQKQKIAIAGILAMKCRCIIFDEPTSMLDPLSRDELIDTIMQLRNEGITIVLITHYAQEAVYADNVIAVDKGRIAAQGRPEDVFSDNFNKKLKSINIGIPPIIETANILREKGFEISTDIKNHSDLIKCLKKIGITQNKPCFEVCERRAFSENIIEVKNLTHSYGDINAVDDVSFCVAKGSFTAIIGHTGSGKSTLIQHLNGLEKPTRGGVFFFGEDINGSKKNLPKIRQNIGLVFQYPETQLFETTVFKDVAFAPINMGLDEAEVKKRVKEALDMVGLDESFYDKMPFSLSGGQKRRAAIAGILAMKPQVLMLDEPTAGLDNSARELLLESIKNMNRAYGITIIFITHNMSDIAELADNIIVMREGKISAQGSPESIFSDESVINSGIVIPETVKLMRELKQINPYVPSVVFSAERAAEIIEQILRRGE